MTTRDRTQRIENLFNGIFVVQYASEETILWIKTKEFMVIGQNRNWHRGKEYCLITLLHQFSSTAIQQVKMLQMQP